MLKESYYIFILFLVFVFGCQTPSKSKQKSKKTIPQFLKAPSFNADSAYFFIKKQVEFGPRVPGTKSHNLTAKYLLATLKRYTPHVLIQSFETKIFDKTLRQGQNIIATFNPNAQKRILLNAHWDSRPFADQDTFNIDKPIDGANDGASGVGVLIELARLFSIYDTFKIGIDLILFDIEDYGVPKYIQSNNKNKIYYCLGSQYWIKNLHVPNYKANYAILVDMVAFQNSIFVKEQISIQYASNLLEKVWNIANYLNYSDLFVPHIVNNTIIHDHYFINQVGIPTIAIMGANPLYLEDKFFIDIWHKHQDDLKHVDKKVLKKVGQVLLTFIYNEK